MAGPELTTPSPARPSPSSSSPPAEGWEARLDLEIIRDGAQSRLGRRRHVGPLRIQRPFYPEGEDQLHLYLLHPPGGLVGGDRLEIDVAVRSGARALLTTPSAQKVYRTRGPRSTQRVTLRVDESGSLEWLPSETLFFDAAQARLETRVELALGATFLGWDITCFGRPASQQTFVSGESYQAFEIFRDTEPLIVDRYRVCGGAPVLQASYGLHGLPASGTLYFVPGHCASAAHAPSALADWVSALRAELSGAATATALEEALIVRARGAHVEVVRRELERAWSCLRRLAYERPPVPPRIWAT